MLQQQTFYMSWVPFHRGFWRKGDQPRWILCSRSTSTPPVPVLSFHLHRLYPRPQNPDQSSVCQKGFSCLTVPRMFSVLAGRHGVGEGGEAVCSHCVYAREARSEQKMEPGCKPSVPRATSSSKAPPHKRSIAFPNNTPAGDDVFKHMRLQETFKPYHQSTAH